MAAYPRYAYVTAYVPSGPTHFYRYRSGSVPREQSITDKRLTLEGKRSANVSVLSASSTSSTSNSYDRFSTGASSDLPPRCARACSELHYGRHLGGRMTPSIRITGRR